MQLQRCAETIYAGQQLEVANEVGDVAFRAIHSGLFQRAIQQPARGSDERPPFAVFRVARLLADQHKAGVPRSFAEDGLRRIFVKRARLARPRGFAQCVQISRCGNLRHQTRDL
ncbi:MAG TPA: hypothetical protein VIS96_07840 [Terrimicrobiaceae bacterium]